MAAAVYGGPVPLAVVTACGIAVLALGQLITARRTLGMAPHATFNIVSAAKYLANLSGSVTDIADPEPASPRREHALR